MPGVDATERRCGLFLRLAAVALIAAVALGCTDADRGISAEVRNQTSVPISVRYQEPGHELDIGTLQPSQGTVIRSVFADRGSACHGPFVARTADGAEIARADELCPGVVWTIRLPGPSHS
jgi:hypothetical protein